MRFLGCLVSCQDLGEAVELMTSEYILISSKYVSENARIIHCIIERKVNNLNLEGEKQSEWRSTPNYLTAVVDVDDLEHDRKSFSLKTEEFGSRKGELEVQNSYHSQINRF